MSASRGQTFMVVAILLGAGAAAVGYVGLRTLQDQVARGGAETVPVVVTAGDLTYGVKLEPNQLRIVRYPRESVPAGAFSAMDSVVGQTTKVFMSAREPVTSIKLSSRGGGLSMLVRPSMRAASVEVNEVSGVSGFVLPGDRVDVLATVNPRGSLDEAVTSTVLQNIEVLAAGQKTQQQDNKPITVQSVTLLLEPEGAETLALAQHEGKINLVLRNPEDQEQVRVGSVSKEDLLRGNRRRPAPAPARAPAPRPVAVTPRPAAPVPDLKVQVIRSTSASEQTVKRDTTGN